MTLEKGKRYISTSPEGNQELVVLVTDEQLEAHTKLVNYGYDYQEMVTHNAPKESACISCEG